MNKNNKVYLAVFYSQTFIFTKLNYDIDNEHLAIFEDFKIWCYYLKGLVFLINIVIDYKNFSTTKILIHKQV